jgi:hypothetical protein
LSLAVALAALPAAALACQLMCAPVSGHAHHRAMHDHATAAAAVDESSDASALRALAERCGHAIVATAIVLPGGIKLPAPPVALRAPAMAPDVWRSVSVASADSTGSPPGAPVRTLSLRI